MKFGDLIKLVWLLNGCGKTIITHFVYNVNIFCGIRRRGVTAEREQVKVVIKLVAYLKDKETGEISIVESFLTRNEMELLCSFKKLKSRPMIQGYILGQIIAYAERLEP